MRTTIASPVDAITGSIRVLIAEDNPYLRKLIRNLLVNVGIKNIDEVTDGLAGFEAIKSYEPDIVILDWELPLLNGVELVRIVRTPGMLARPAVPIIMFGASAERWRIAEAKRLGVNAYLTMPVSAKTLLDRILSILAKSRPVVAPQGDRVPNQGAPDQGAPDPSKRIRI
jgi:two-component system chemotaxis response regulator CheY